MTITSLDDVSDRRLTWPEQKPRSSSRRGSAFGPTSIDAEIREISYELGRFGAKRYIVSRNVDRMFAGDPAVALWWTMKKEPKDGPNLRVLACDQYASQAHNAHAILLTLGAMRGLERWGAYTIEQAIEGARLTLPPPEGASEIVWRAVFGDLPAGVTGDDALAIVNSRYRRQAAEASGNDKELTRLNLAIERAREELK